MMKKSSLRKRIYQAFKFFYKLTGQCRKMDDYFLVERFAQSLGSLHFIQDGSSAEEQRAFLKEHLVEVEVETHGFCNRACSFCPNAVFSRSNKTEIMPEALFTKIITELKGLDYSNTLKVHRYNEPLALDIIFDRIRQARQALPKAYIGFHSNGDYVTLDKLKELEEAGNDFVIIGVYLNLTGNREEQVAEARSRCTEYISRRGLKAEEVDRDGSLIRYVIAMDRMKVSLFVPDTENKWNDRGGTLIDYSKAVRISPCESPFGRLLVDWTGDVLPCCNLRGDVPAHKPYILGNVATMSLEDIFFSKVANSLRRKLVGFHAKDGACRTCHYASFPQDESFKVLMTQAVRRLKG